MKIKISFLLVLISLTLTVTAQTGKYQWQTASGTGHSFKAVSGDPMKARFYTLRNGMSVILSVNKKEPRI